VHEFRTLSAQQLRELLAQRWRPAGVALPGSLELKPETVAAIIRVNGWELPPFRALNHATPRMPHTSPVKGSRVIERVTEFDPGRGGQQCGQAVALCPLTAKPE
jgi:hypothetical protein